jgi:DNA-binding MarR family transcriptional regulator
MQGSQVAALKRKKAKKPHKPTIRKRSKKRASGAVDYEALAQFRYQLRLFVAFADANAKKAGLTSQQFQALLAVKGFSSQKPMFVGELAEVLLSKHHTVVELVNRIAKLKLLQRSVDADDNRRVLVTLTKKGHHLVERVAEVNFKHLAASKLALSKITKLLS